MVRRWWVGESAAFAATRSVILLRVGLTAGLRTVRWSVEAGIVCVVGSICYDWCGRDGSGRVRDRRRRCCSVSGRYQLCRSVVILSPLQNSPEMVHLLHHRREEWRRWCISSSPPSSAEEECGENRHGCQDGHDHGGGDLAVRHAMTRGTRRIRQGSAVCTRGREAESGRGGQ